MTTTRQRILSAVRDAAREVPLDDLTPAEIARRSGVHRVTFYRFWSDAQAAAIEAYTEEIDRLVAADDLLGAEALPVASLAEVYDQILEDSLVEILERRPTYRVLFAWPTFQSHVLDALHARARVMIDTVQRSGVAVSGAESGAAAGFLAGASLGVLITWANAEGTDAHARAREVVAQMPPWWPSR